MAAGTWTPFRSARLAVMNGQIDFDGHTFIAVPLNNSVTPDPATHDQLADLVAGEVLDTGNVSLRETLANPTLNVDGATGNVTWTADNIVFETAGDPQNVKWVAVYDDTAANDPLVAFFDVSTGDAAGLGITQLTVQNTAGILRLS